MYIQWAKNVHLEKSKPHPLGQGLFPWPSGYQFGFSKVNILRSLDSSNISKTNDKIEVCSFISTYFFSPSRLNEQSIPLNPGSQSHSALSLVHFPLSLQEDRPLHLKSGHFPSCKPTSPWQLFLAWRFKKKYVPHWSKRYPYN